MSQTGAGTLGGSPGDVSVTLTIGGTGAVPPAVTHPGVGTPPAPLPYTGAPVLAEIDAALLAVVTGALIVRLTSGGTRELVGLLRRARGSAS